MYVYYEKVQTNEHYLYPTEIAENLNLYSKEGKLHHTAMITCLMNLIEERDGMRPLYFKTATTGLRRVCRQTTKKKIYHLIMNHVTVTDQPVKVNIANRSFICMILSKEKEGVA